MSGLGLGLDLLGAGVGALGQASKARKSNRLLAEGTRAQERAGQEGAQVMGDFITQLRASRANPAAEQGAFTSALRGPAITGPMTASRAFHGDSHGATAATQGYGNQLAELFARIRAPGLQRQREGQLMAEAGNKLRPIQMRAQDEDFLTQFKAGRVKDNPLYSIIGGGLQNAGNYLIGDGG